MNTEVLTLAIQLVFGTGGLGVIVTGVVSLVKSRQEGERLEADLRDRMLERASSMLQAESLRVDQAMARLQEAENAAGETKKELRKLEAAFDMYQKTMEIEQRRVLTNLDEVYGWIEDGATPPPPRRPDWLKGFNNGLKA